ncbi:hypothetical protein SRDD_24640 [Serratia sp. DD3]|nr:hypothetical protein SRDD_24640 [Serratia sp. DD3]
MALAPPGPPQAADLSLTPVTYQCKLLGILCVAAFLQLELFNLSSG